MITRVRPIKAQRRYASNEWRPYFAWCRRIEFSMPGAPMAVDGKPERVACWVFFEWIETVSLDHDGRPPWVYRLRPPA